jgi:hypothetical protein
VYSIDGADGQTYGPAHIDTLIEWAREGRVVPRTSVTDHDTGRRFLACDLAELAAIFDPEAVTGAAPPTADPLPVIDLRSATEPPARRSRGRACPRCGSHHLGMASGSSKASFACCSCIFAPILLPLVFFLPRTRRVCLNCGLEW